LTDELFLNPAICNQRGVFKNHVKISKGYPWFALNISDLEMLSSWQIQA